MIFFCLFSAALGCSSGGGGGSGGGSSSCSRSPFHCPDGSTVWLSRRRESYTSWGFFTERRCTYGRWSPHSPIAHMSDNSKLLAEVERQCWLKWVSNPRLGQCSRTDWNNMRSSPICIGYELSSAGTVLDNQGYEVGCAIHDRCYYLGNLLPGRTRLDCDREQRHNHYEMCKNKFKEGSNDYLACTATAQTIYELLQGKSFLDPFKGVEETAVCKYRKFSDKRCHNIVVHDTNNQHGC